MELNEILTEISQRIYYWKVAAAQEEINAIERKFGVKLPNDFREFLRLSDGGCILFEKISFFMNPAQTILKNDYENLLRKYLGDRVVMIGSDGGEFCFLLDYRNGEIPEFASVPFGDMGLDTIKILAPSFSAAIELALNGEIDLDAP